MKIRLKPFDLDETEALVSFLTGQPWPYHGNPNPSEESIRDGVANGRYTGEDTLTLWIVEGDEKLGLIRLFDLGDLTPVFDIRIDAARRGQGVGTAAVRLLADYVFTEFPDKIRFEGHTRNDNYAMRKTFAKAGFAKEAYHRKAWPTNGTLYDSVGYSLLREDWAEGKVSPIDWNDFPY
ncbi:GNAT family protein [Paenibacillus sp.]|uniref:GNAT family N-acetyltransferase n=1 Tax=Paenibacillus sp. TaxID=58172 RepID=UPI0028127D50|nr:GNAT family protein [Paenibacillus sp.]